MNIVELVLRDLSETYVQRILPVLSDRMNHSPHLEFYLHWCTTLLSLHTRTLKEKGLETMSFLTDLQKSIVQRQTDLGKLYAYIIIIICSGCGNSQSYKTLSDKSSECLVNWNWTVYKVYGKQDKSGQNVWQLAHYFHIPLIHVIWSHYLHFQLIKQSFRLCYSVCTGNTSANLTLLNF